jgi:Rrf2 family nitric oxide-sensitive transcriptional repressor
MQLTTHTDYALRLLIFLASQPERKVSTREVAEAYNISLHHLTKVAKSLTKGGWLVAARGGGGGLELAPQTAETRLGEIVRYTEFSHALAECFTPASNTCPITRVCCLKPVLYRAQKAFFDVLDTVTVRDIARNPEELGLVLAPARTAPRKPNAASTQTRLRPAR